VTCEPRLLFASVIGCDDGIDENRWGGLHGGARCARVRPVDWSLVEFVDFGVDLVDVPGRVWVIWGAWSTRMGKSTSRCLVSSNIVCLKTIRVNKRKRVHE
jgi:hypothetical protein